MASDGKVDDGQQRLTIEDVATPEILSYYEYWNNLRGERIAPSWREVHLDELDPKIVPYIIVCDVLRDPLRFLVRFWGTQHTTRKGDEKTGKLIGSALYFRGERAMNEYRSVVETQAPVASLDTVNLDEFGQLAPFEQKLVRFPLSDDGMEVHHVITVAAWDER